MMNIFQILTEVEVVYQRARVSAVGELHLLSASKSWPLLGKYRAEVSRIIEGTEGRRDELLMKLEVSDKKFLEMIYTEEFGNNADPITTFRDRYVASKEPLRVGREQIGAAAAAAAAAADGNNASPRVSISTTTTIQQRPLLSMRSNLPSKHITSSSSSSCDRLLNLHTRHAKFMASTTTKQQQQP
ncbi:hypothetical protein FOZ61_000569 [Perkinsus olseni]|uniref:Uncharacterized protein n=1 Tax=Perkinsus olseni TaxID=32597 RepID=A0A7J6M0J7_PEROL|nr:hypothetical protein FOZ61_000569 [Perkinsus olseni]